MGSSKDNVSNSCRDASSLTAPVEFRFVEELVARDTLSCENCFMKSFKYA